ncbi:hypothetical protein FKM82_024157 [Ascaphus truei]
MTECEMLYFGTPYLRFRRAQRIKVSGVCSHCSGITAELSLTLLDQPDGVWTPLKIRDFSYRLQWRRIPIDLNGGNLPLKVYGGEARCFQWGFSEKLRFLF